jgi:hypothetical protein
MELSQAIDFAEDGYPSDNERGVDRHPGRQQ